MKYIKHNNILKPNPGLNQNGYNYFNFVCRGCTIRDREQVWEGFLSSIYSDFDKETDNSYLTLEEEPDNDYDPNAIVVVVRGEFFGTAGYVGKEYAAEIKTILNSCVSYRVDMMDFDSGVQREIQLIITWK